MKITGKYIDKIQKNNPLKSKNHLIILFKAWLRIPDIYHIGNLNEKKGVEPLIWVALGSNYYHINSDSNKEGIKSFLKNEEQKNPWLKIKTEAGNSTKITNNIDGSPIKGFYMYINI
tara:strand:- start:1268 stop:1618 length:351 start_codon:yes stop_codon:yes gene_type:complete